MNNKVKDFMQNHIAGLLYIASGCLLLVYATSYLLIPILALVAGLALINYGLKLIRKPTLMQLATKYVLFRGRF